MKYDVVQKCDGNLVIVSTWVNNLEGANKAFHDRCSLLINDKSFESGYVAILDNDLNVMRKEFIDHSVAPEPEPEPEPTEE